MAHSIRSALTKLERDWGVRPYAALACAGGSDEHWQIWHPVDLGEDEPVPVFVLREDHGELEAHPDYDGIVTITR